MYHTKHNTIYESMNLRATIIESYLRYEKILLSLFVGLLLSISFYYLDWHNALLWKSGVKFHILDTKLDLLIPFVPGFVWIYVLYYIFCFTPIIIMNNMDTFRRIALGYLLEGMISFAVFLFYPTKMIRPEIVGNSLSDKLLTIVYNTDPGFNVFPSLHVANSLFVALIFYRYNKKIGLVFLAIALLISISIFFVKQHYLVDFVGGAIEAIGVYLLVFKGHVFVHKGLNTESAMLHTNRNA
ncbi:MAG: phosphatase PAP2 family protein [bacterium]